MSTFSFLNMLAIRESKAVKRRFLKKKFSCVGSMNYDFAIEPFVLFYRGVFDYMCFTVMFHRRCRRPLRIEQILVLWSCIRIKGAVSRQFNLFKPLVVFKITILRPFLCSITKIRLFKYIENFTTKNRKFSDKKPLFFIFLLKTDYGYSLEPPRRGGSNEYPRSMF